MNKIISMLLLAFFFTLCSCNREDLDDIRAAQSEMEARLSALEAWQKTVNTDILHLQTVVSSLEANDYVLSVTTLSDGSGYVINFSKSGAVTIKHGAKGETGDKGDKGDTGDKGDKGDTGSAPVVSVSQDSDGVFYWTLDGEWLTDAEGHKLRVTGEDGKDGASGTAGKDAIAPQVRINSTSNEWEISTDGGSTWTSTGVPATGDTGATGPAGATGDSWISGISYSSDGKNWSDTSSSNSHYVKFTLAKGGGELVFPTQAWAKAVETHLETLTRQIEAFSKLITGKSFITKVEEISESGGSGRKGQKITYVVAKADGSTDKEDTFIVYDGEKGADGTTPEAPVIGVTKEGDNYYWTVGGKKLTDASGNFIPATAPTPQVKLGSNISGVTTDAAGNSIEDSSYYLSVDNGKPWYKVSGPKGDAGIQGPAGEKGDPGDSFFQSVEGKDASGNLLDVITFTLASKDGSGNNLTFEVLRYKAFKIGTGEGNGVYTVIYNSAGSTATLPLSLPSDFKETDYTGIMAQIISEQGTGTAIETRAATGPWTVTIKKPTFAAGGSCNNDATVTVTSPASSNVGDKAVLEVTLIGNDGSKLVATRALTIVSLQAGDFYMSDGTLVSKDVTLTDTQKAACIGIVFWVGDPTKSDHTTANTGSNKDGTTLTDFGDPALKEEHPGCTHGLVVALKNAATIQWQTTASDIESWRTGNTSTVTSKNYLTPVKSGYGATDPANKLRGYNNTVVMRAYNAYCTTTGTTMDGNLILPIAAIDAYARSVIAPGGSSGWYFPSAKELSLLCGTDVNNIFYNNSGGTDSKKLMNTQFNNKLNVGSYDAFGDEYYWASMEREDNQNATWGVGFGRGDVSHVEVKSWLRPVRPILAF